MRPHKLVMKAFGPFAKETTVDFDAMGNSIYLISGDTGSGKTTIFDGIIYALYGTASGGARSGLGTEAFHSDYAKDNQHREEMRVELTFSNAGKTFTACRRMYWGKSGDAQKAVKESWLTENGNTIVNGKGSESKDDVTKKVTEILGLDADQFRRIIMLAQGEFQKFLTANSNDRGIILGKLYDNRRHQDFQLRLKAASKLLNDKDNAAVEQVKAQLNIFVFPEDVSDDELMMVSADHPLLIDAIENILARVRSDLRDVQNKISAEQKEQKTLEAQKIKQEENNKLFDDLDNKTQKLALIKKDDVRMNILKNKIEQAKRAEKVLPVESAMKHTVDDAIEADKKVMRLEEEKISLESQSVELSQKAENIGQANEARIVELKKEVSELQSVLHFYDDLVLCITEQESVRKLYDDTKKKAEEIQKNLDHEKDKLTELKSELENFANAGELEISLNNELEKLKARGQELAGIQLSVKSMQKLEEKVSELSCRSNSANIAAVEAEKKHCFLNEAFINGQAGIIAQNLRNNLENQIEVVCPVCGAKHTIKDADRFAELHEDVPLKEEVDAAYKAWESAREKSQAVQKDYSEKSKELSLAKQTLLDETEKLISVSDWEILIAGPELNAAIETCHAEIVLKQKEYNQAVKNKESRDKAEQEKAEVEERISEYEYALAEVNQKRNESGNKSAAADAKVSSCKEQLQTYPAKKSDAENLIKELTEKITALQKEIDKVQKALAECRNNQAENAGRLKNAVEEKEKRHSEQIKAEKDFENQLKNNSFANTGEYYYALRPDSITLSSEELSYWIEKNQSEVDTYEQNCNNLDAAVRQLKKSTEGMERIDISDVINKLSDVTDSLKILSAREKSLSSCLQTDEKVYGAISETKDKRTGYKKIAAELNPVSDTADGKFTFSRYVLTGFFHRITDQANIHLETMTDGEYCLIPKETGDGRLSSGLGLKVLNTITNNERDTASLSGGQLFEASLSLALGLSEIVQMESTGSIQTDSMFIDEGFGSLDGGRLDKSIDVLQHLSAGKRQIGIISHVARLEECLPKKIHVIAGDKGSSVKTETDS